MIQPTSEAERSVFENLTPLTDGQLSSLEAEAKRGRMTHSADVLRLIADLRQEREALRFWVDEANKRGNVVISLMAEVELWKRDSEPLRHPFYEMKKRAEKAEAQVSEMNDKWDSFSALNDALVARARVAEAQVAAVRAGLAERLYLALMQEIRDEWPHFAALPEVVRRRWQTEADEILAALGGGS